MTVDEQTSDRKTLMKQAEKPKRGLRRSTLLSPTSMRTKHSVALPNTAALP